MSDTAHRSWFPILFSTLLNGVGLLLGASACQSVEPEPGVTPGNEDEPRETVLDHVVQSLPWTDEVPEAPRLDGEMGGRFVSVRGARLYVIEQGEGTPIVLLNGGPGLSLHAFVPHFSPAAEFARLIYYDPRGVGRSEWKPEDGYNVAQALLDLEDLRGQLGIESWVVLGWSWGAHLARLYALCYPERVRGLVLVSALADLEARQRPRTPTHHTVDEAKRIRACFTYKGKLAKAAHSDSVPLHQVQRMVYNALRNGEWKRKYFIRPTDERLSQIAQHEWVHDLNYTRGMRRSADIRLKGAFAATPFATLIIDGRWDMTFPPDKGRLLALEIDGSREVILENASHHVFAEEPGRFFELLEEFVAQPAPDAGRLHAWREHTAPWADKILGGDGGG